MISFSSLLEESLLIERCTVFHWDRYEFSTGQIKDKFWVTLNCKINDFPIKVVLPTSQYDNYHYSITEHLEDCVIIEKGESIYFNADKTILDLKNIISEDEYKIRIAYEDEFLVKLGPLEPEICARIEKKIEESELLDPFIIDELLCRKS